MLTTYVAMAATAHRTAVRSVKMRGFALRTGCSFALDTHNVLRILALILL